MAEFGCCKRAGQRVYYLVMAIIYGVTLVIELVTLGTFGVQFSRTRNFWRDNINGDSQVCVLYGGGVDANGNPSLGNNASCGFTLWGLVTVILVLVVWIVFHIIMAILGRPKITSLFRIIDLIMASLMAFLSLIISSVLTGGLAQTCGNTRISDPNGSARCNRKKFMGTSGDLSFFGSLDAAKDTSWTVTIVFIMLIGWYIMLLVMHCCISKYRKEEELDQIAEERKKKEEMADVAEGDEQQEKEIVDETFPQENEEEKN